MISSLFLSSAIFLAFGIPSGIDLFVLLVIVLLLFGAKRLPEIARSLGQSVHEFKKAKQEFDNAVNAPSQPTQPQATSTEPSAPATTTPSGEPVAPHQS